MLRAGEASLPAPSYERPRDRKSQQQHATLHHRQASQGVSQRLQALASQHLFLDVARLDDAAEIDQLE
jgi:hypothetical protein